MIKIYSKDNQTLLHIVYRFSDIVNVREDICPNEEFIQVSSLNLKQDQTFKPHKHIEQIRTTDIAQESWVILKGAVEATYFDLDDQVIQKIVLHEGDLTVTFRGGHNYRSLFDNTIVYEFKTGPYQGQEKDKTFI